MSMAQNIKETLIEQYSLEMHDSLKLPTATTQEIIENSFSFDPAALASPESLYLGNKSSFFGALSGMEVFGGLTDRRGILAQLALPKYAELSRNIGALFDEELRALRPGQEVTEKTFGEKVRLISFGCFVDCLLANENSGQSHCGCQSE